MILRWRIGILGVVSAGCLGLSLACGAIFPEIATPIGPPPNLESPSPEPPDDYVYFYLKTVRVQTQTRDGRKWGKGGDGLPNPYAILFIDGTEVTRTEVQPDTLQPVWAKQKKANYKMRSDTRLRIEIWDDHGLFPHPICMKEMLNLPSYLELGEAKVDCNGGAQITLAVEPAHARWGLGFYYELRTSSVYITRVIAASSAGRAGLKPGDQILSIMDKAVAQMESGEVQSLIRSNASSGVELKVSSSERATREVTLRDEALYPLIDEGIPLN